MFSRIAIAAAMENEIGFLRNAMNSPDRTKDRFVVGTIGSKTIMILRTGVGPQKTAQRLAEITNAHDPQFVLSIGCAGALSPNVTAGDVVIPEKIVDDTANGTAYFPSPELIRVARDCCERFTFPFHVGTTVSTANVAATPEGKEKLAIQYDALAVDMESAQVAAWADGLGIPMLTIRTISDTAADRIPPEIALLVDSRGKLLVHKALATFVRRPALLLELFRLKRKLDRSLEMLENIVLSFLRNV